MLKLFFICQNISENISTVLTFGLAVTFPTILSVIASSLAIIWWLAKFYDKYEDRLSKIEWKKFFKRKRIDK